MVQAVITDIFTAEGAPIQDSKFVQDAVGSIVELEPLEIAIGMKLCMRRLTNAKGNPYTGMFVTKPIVAHKIKDLNGGIRLYTLRTEESRWYLRTLKK